MAGRATNTHSLNVVIACLTQLIITFRTYIETIGISEGPVIDQLREMELVLPTCLNLKHEFISDKETAALLGKTHVPIVDTPIPADTLPPGQAAENFLLQREV